MARQTAEAIRECTAIALEAAFFLLDLRNGQQQQAAQLCPLASGGLAEGPSGCAVGVRDTPTV